MTSCHPLPAADAAAAAADDALPLSPEEAAAAAEDADPAAEEAAAAALPAPAVEAELAAELAADAAVDAAADAADALLVPMRAVMARFVIVSI